MEKTAGLAQRSVSSLTHEELNLFTRFLDEKHGLAFPPERSRALSRAVQSRLQGTRALTAARYHRTLLHNESELQLLVDAATNGLSRFFRNESQLRVLTDVVLPRLIAVRRTATAGAAAAAAAPGGPGPAHAGPLLLWSAGCSTGEEPWTLAMLMKESLPDGLDFSIVATDISLRALAVAERAAYSRRRAEAVPALLRARYFRQTANGYEVVDELRRRVSFRAHNVTTPAPVRNADVVFCRNVLTYLSEPARRTAVEELAAAVAEDGYLFIGNSESLRGCTARFRSVRTPHGRVHQRGLPPRSRMSTMMGCRRNNR